MNGISVTEVAKAKIPAGWDCAPRFAETSLTGTLWSFGALGRQPYTPFLVLAPDGLIGNYCQANEDLWQIVDGRLAFMSSRGVATTIFDRAQSQAGIVTALCGRVRLPGAVAFHELRRAAHPTPGSADRRAHFLQALAQPKHPNLVVLRAGDTSLHPAWPRDLAEDGRNWDLCISAYGQALEPLHAQADYLTHQPHQRKFPAIHDLFFAGSPLWQYERVWFPDDDLMMRWSDINLIFHLARKYSLDLAQPSLLPVPGCFITHGITAQRPASILRFVDFVEIMCPAFSLRALRLCLPTFRDSISGFGLDHLWPSLLGGPRARMAIIDATGIIHTRPIGRNYDVRSAITEEAALLKAYNLVPMRMPALTVPV